MNELKKEIIERLTKYRIESEAALFYCLRIDSIVCKNTLTRDIIKIALSELFYEGKVVFYYYDGGKQRYALSSYQPYGKDRCVRLIDLMISERDLGI